MEELNKGYEFTKAQIAELESLRAWKAELEKQEPVAFVTYKGQLLHAHDPKVAEHSNPEPLFAAPVVSPDVAALTAELETERMRLAACGVAALGYFDGCKDEYRSASLDDTLRLYAENQSLKTELEAVRKDAERYRWLREADQNTVLRYSHYAFEALDKVIDAAIEQAKGGME